MEKGAVRLPKILVLITQASCCCCCCSMVLLLVAPHFQHRAGQPEPFRTHSSVSSNSNICSWRVVVQPPHAATAASRIGRTIVELDANTMRNQTTGVSILNNLWTPDVHFTNTTEMPTSDASLVSVNESGHIRWVIASNQPSTRSKLNVRGC